MVEHSKDTKIIHQQLKYMRSLIGYLVWDSESGQLVIKLTIEYRSIDKDVEYAATK